jgi:serine/threonine-protein kinase
MAPELWTRQASTEASDVYSLGLVLYELCVGRLPYQDVPLADLPQHVQDHDVPPLTEAAPEADPRFAAIVDRCLAPDPARRFSSGRALAAELEGLQESLAGRTPSRRQRVLLAGVFALLVLGLSAFLLSGRRQRADSLAVLPFAGTGEDAEYLSEGITESLINSVSQIPSLKVIARSSVFNYKGRPVDPRKVGSELGVRTLLLGQVAQRGDRITISAELVDTRDGSRIWGAEYNRKAGELSVVPEEIVREISEKLRGRPTGETRKRLARRYTENTEAYRLYLKGRYHWNRRTDESIAKAVQLFQEALAVDPGYALAHAGLADAYGIMGYRRTLPPQEAWSRTKAEANKALEIDEGLAEAHTALAFAAFNYDWDFPTAGREFERALELNPSYAHARHWYSHYLTALGRRDESLAQSRRALELDPLDLPINVHLAWHFLMAREYDQALEQVRRVLEMDPNRQTAYLRLGDAHEAKRQYDDAIRDYRKAGDLGPDNTEALAGLGHAYGKSGRRAEALAVLDELAALGKTRYVSAFDVAVVHLGLGERNSGFEWLERAYEGRGTALVYLNVDPRLDELRGDPRFLDLARRLGLK